MDHKFAESLQSVEKYTLNEMSAEERTAFEEHMFDCPICSEQLRQNFTLVENLKEVLREEPATQHATAPVARSGWRAWLLPSSLVPTFAAAALACVLVFQHIGGGNQEIARVLPLASVVTSVERDASAPVQMVDPESPTFIVTFGVDRLAEGFACEFTNKAGKKVASVSHGPESVTSFNLPVELPTKSFPPGEYRMSLRPESKPDSIKTYPFVVEYSK
jgi:hypothetical protein